VELKATGQGGARASPPLNDGKVHITLQSMAFCADVDNVRSYMEERSRHELYSPAQTLGSWVRIPLETWMSCVQVEALRRTDPHLWSTTDCIKDQETGKAAKVQQRAVEP
jgi:hypothetical protein